MWKVENRKVGNTVITADERQVEVSFIVPCYKLGHLLAECIESILLQSYRDFEILIMDDCSPDSTPDIAKSFLDPRIKYIRNESNLGNLRNYNKGISLARGEYIWLISADDRLRRPYVLERYVRLMEDHPKVGFVFCRAVNLINGQEGRVLDYGDRGGRDRIFGGHDFFFEIIMQGNTVVAPTGMARKECYERVSLFPLDLPWGGDWYLWTIFAAYYDVAYLAEPMVNYRRHELSMTDALVRDNVRHCAESDIEVPRRIMAKMEEAGFPALAKRCRQAIAYQYSNNIASREYRYSSAWSHYSMSLGEFEDSLFQVARNPTEQKYIRARAYAGLADRYYGHADFVHALEFYRRAAHEEPMMLMVWMKYLLLRLGHAGIRFRASLWPIRQMIRRIKNARESGVVT